MHGAVPTDPGTFTQQLLCTSSYCHDRNFLSADVRRSVALPPNLELALGTADVCLDFLALSGLPLGIVHLHEHIAGYVHLDSIGRLLEDGDGRAHYEHQLDSGHAHHHGSGGEDEKV